MIAATAQRTCYFDASALVKRYVDEPGRGEVLVLLSGSRAVTARFTFVEITSALCRRRRDGQLSPSGAGASLAAVARDIDAIDLVEFDAAGMARAMHLLERHALRAADAMQLAACLIVRDDIDEAVVFACFDTRLRMAAAAEGIIVVPEALA